MTTRLLIFLSVFLLLLNVDSMAQKKVVKRKQTTKTVIQQHGTQKPSTSAGFSTKAISDKTVTVNGVSFVMKGVQGGTFTMGKTQEQVCPDFPEYNESLPKHRVSLSSFRIGQTEVTQELWQAVMGNNPVVEDDRGEKKPVSCVSWYDCQEFISKLNELTGLRFRLPTEAEWEYAARGGNKSRHYTYSGSNDLDKITTVIGTGKYKEGHYNVASKAPNELGIYDMTGNICEWTADWSSQYSARSQVNPKGPKSGNYKIIRGGNTTDDYNRKCFYYVSSRATMSPKSNIQTKIGLRLAM